MSASNTPSQTVDNIHQSAISTKPPGSGSPVQSYNPKTQVFLALIGGIIIFISMLVFRFSRCPTKWQQRQRRIWLSNQQNLPTMVHHTHESETENRTLTVDELDKRFPVQKYKSFRESSSSKALRRNASCPTLSSSRTKLKPVDTCSQGRYLEDVPLHFRVHTRSPGIDWSACSICLDAFEEENDIRVLTCDHTFHATCLDAWLTGWCACCPLCRKDYHVSGNHTSAV